MRSCRFLAAALWCAPAAGCGRAARPQPPRIVFAQAQHDFGRVEQGTLVHYAYPFRNGGGLTLSVDHVRASCDCTAALTSPRTLAPGGSGTIQVTYDTTYDLGRQAKSVTVYANDPQHPVSTLTLRGEIDADIAADPARLYVGHLRRGETASGVVQLVSGGGATSVAAGALETSGRVLSVRLQGTATPGTAGAVQVAIRPDAPLGPFAASILVHTASPRHPLLAVPVTGIVDGDVVISPRQLDFGRVHPGAAPTQPLAVHNYGSTPVRITAAGISPPLGRVFVTTVQPGREYRLTVTLNAATPAHGAPHPRTLRATVQVHTDRADEPLISVPLVARPGAP